MEPGRKQILQLAEVVLLSTLGIAHTENGVTVCPYRLSADDDKLSQNPGY